MQKCKQGEKMTHHEGHHEHHHQPESHPGDFEHHAGECPYCKHGKFGSKDEEIDALKKFREDVNTQLSDIDRRIEELKKG
jgi:hypothetical protein